jgi:S-formylglutathione hydrolase
VEEALQHVSFSDPELTHVLGCSRPRPPPLSFRYDFVTSELPQLLEKLSLPLDLSRSSIFGHSMGGHGALTLYLKSVLSSSSATATTKYLSASAFAPIANPTQCPWGEKAFGGYLNGGVEEGKEYDATELIKQAKGKDLKILIDVGTGDNFYKQKQRELAPWVVGNPLLHRCLTC